MDNKMLNDLTPEQIQELFAMAKSMEQPNRMLANMGESADLKQMMGMPPRSMPSPMPSESPFSKSQIMPLPLPANYDSKSKIMPLPLQKDYNPKSDIIPLPNMKKNQQINKIPYPDEQEDIHPEDMTKLHELLHSSDLQNTGLEQMDMLNKMMPQQGMTKGQQFMGQPSPSPQEYISPEDMDALKKILMNQGQGEMPSPTPSPMASPFRNIRGTIDRSK